MISCSWWCWIGHAHFRLQIWAERSGRPDLLGKSVKYVYDNCRLCAEHFEPSQFMNQNQRNSLVHSALPTIFDAPKPSPLRPSVSRTRENFYSSRSQLKVNGNFPSTTAHVAQAFQNLQPMPSYFDASAVVEKTFYVKAGENIVQFQDTLASVGKK